VLKKTNLLSFDDVWLEPRYSEIESRSNPDLSSALSPFVTLKHPVIATNIASVVGEKMAHTLDKSGSIAFYHRFLSRDDLIHLTTSFPAKMKYFPFSIGVKEEDLNVAKDIFYMLGNYAIILVDIAHGHSKKMGDFVSKVKKIGFNTVVAGNVATQEGYKFLVDHGADSVRVGVAGGKACTTKYVTGHHIPTLQSVYEVASCKTTASIIADGAPTNFIMACLQRQLWISFLELENLMLHQKVKQLDCLMLAKLQTFSKISWQELSLL